MKANFFLIIIFLEISLIQAQTVQNSPANDLKLWYDQPAKLWVEALPLGNGRLGAMVFGNPFREQIQLNENTIYAGGPYRNDNHDALDALTEIRQLIFEGKFAEAEQLACQKIISQGAHGMPYQTAGEVYLSFPGHEACSDYYRELNLEKAVATTTYKVKGTRFTREVFASFSDQVIIVRITADNPGKINFAVSVNRPAQVGIQTIGMIC